MKMKYVSVLLLLLTLLHLNSYSQVRNVKNVDSVQIDESKDLQEQLLPLDSIITIALNNSPSIKFQQDVVEANKYQVDFVKKEWTNNISAYGNYTNGNQSLITADNQTPLAVNSNSLMNGYRAGVQVTIPLYNFTGHKSRVALYKATLQSSIDKRDEVKQDLVSFIIEQYYKLIYYRNLIAIRSEGKQSGINQVHVAEQQFKDGIIQVSELSRLKTIEVNARADYEDAKRQFATLYFQFQNLVGVPIKQLIVTK